MTNQCLTWPGVIAMLGMLAFLCFFMWLVKEMK